MKQIQPTLQTTLQTKPIIQAPSWQLGVVSMLSAGMSGSLAEMCTLPIDTLKVRLQIASSKGSSGFVPVLTNLVRKEGLLAFYGGAAAAVQRQLVMASVKFGCYEPVKKQFCCLFNCDSDPARTPKLIKLLSASTTGLVAVLCGQPTDVVKVRMQAQNRSESLRYTSCRSAYSQIYSSEGLRGLWRGTLPSASRNIVVNASEIAMYDIIKTWLIQTKLMDEGSKCFLVSAGLTGIVATAIASPIDVVKTRYMNASIGQYSSMLDCVASLWRENGASVFYRGVLPAGVRLVCWNIVMFMTFEHCKSFAKSTLISSEGDFKFR